MPSRIEMPNDGIRDVAPPAACLVCGASSPRHLYDVRGFAVWRCAACDLRWVHPRPEATEDFYDEEYFQGGKDGLGYGDYVGQDHWYGPRVYAEMRDRLLERFPQRGRLLDVGCAAGHLVEAAAGDGWEASGIDVGAYVVEHGRARGLDLRAVTLQEAGFPARHFDVVTSFHTVEHLPDPLGDLREARRIARDGAMLVVEVPNVGSLGSRIRRDRWSQLKPPEHINFFNRRSLAILMRRAGWRPVHSHTLDLGAVVSATVAAGERRALAKAAGAAGRVAEAVGAWKAVNALGMGGNLRMYATADGGAAAGQE